MWAPTATKNLCARKAYDVCTHTHDNKWRSREKNKILDHSQIIHWTNQVIIIHTEDFHIKMSASHDMYWRVHYLHSNFRSVWVQTERRSSISYYIYISYTITVYTRQRKKIIAKFVIPNHQPGNLTMIQLKKKSNWFPTILGSRSKNTNKANTNTLSCLSQVTKQQRMVRDPFL